MATLAYTHSWRTPTNIKLLSRAINHINNDLINATEGVLVKGGTGYMSAFGSMIRPHPLFTIDSVDVAVMHRRLLTEMAMSGAGKEIEILRQSADNIEEALQNNDGILQLNYSSEAQKKALTGGKYKAVGGYGEVFLEPNYKKKTALDCDLTFWTVQLLSLMNNL